MCRDATGLARGGHSRILESAWLCAGGASSGGGSQSSASQFGLVRSAPALFPAAPPPIFFIPPTVGERNTQVCVSVCVGVTVLRYASCKHKNFQPGIWHHRHRHARGFC